jgi:hypothetical protein
MAALSEKYSAKNLMTLPATASTVTSPNISAIAATGCVGTRSLSGSANRRYHGTAPGG